MSSLYLALDTALERFGWLDRANRAAHPTEISVNTWAFLAITAVVALVRLPTITFAYLNIDEAVYTLIGAGLKLGHIPYVDVVDRKPVGLFLIYAFAEALFRDGVVGPRLLAGIATAASGFGLFRFAQRFLAVSTGAALAGAFFFCTYGVLFGGDAAQAPVFYMPLVIGAAGLVALTLRRLAAGETPDAKSIGLAGLMLGLALQIKPSMIFECAGFGGILLAFGATRGRFMSQDARRALMTGIALMVGGGLLPTVIAGAAYAALGHFDAWVFYNFTVNFLREESDYSRGAILLRIAQFTLCFLPLCVLAAVYARAAIRTAGALRRNDGFIWLHLLLAVWVVCALVGGLALRQPYGHYFYGLVAPLALLAGAALHRREETTLSLRSQSILVGVLALACAAYAYGWRHEVNKNGSPFLAYRLADEIKSLKSPSLYVFNHFGILYYLTGAPLPTRYPMPNHLLRDLEAKSFQFDGPAEVQRVLNGRPETIVAMRPFSAMTAPDRVALLEHTLSDSYCAWRTYRAGEHTVSLYRWVGEGAGRTTCDKAAVAQADDLEPAS